MKISRITVLFLLFLALVTMYSFQHACFDSPNIERHSIGNQYSLTDIRSENSISSTMSTMQDAEQWDVDLHVAEFFYVALGILFILPFVTLYFIPKQNAHHLTLKNLSRILLLDAFFVTVFLIIEFLSNPTKPVFNLIVFQHNTSEFFIVSFLWLFVYVTVFYPYFMDLLKQSVFYESDLPYPDLLKAVNDSVSKLGGRSLIPRESIPRFFQYQVRGTYYLAYTLSVLISEKNANTGHSKISFTFNHSLRNLNMLKILTFVMFGVVLLARSTWNLQPEILRGTPIDAELFFTLLAFAFIFFNLLIAYTCENLIFQREAAYEKSLLDLKKLNRESLEEVKRRAKEKLGLQGSRPDAPDIQDIKRKAKERLDLSVKKAEEEKTEKIDKILDRADSKLNKQINPDIIRLEALIRETKKILNATPETHSIELGKIVDLLGGTEKTSVEEVEQIIIGLVTKREVRGEYDIWIQTYYGSNTRTRFINRTLEGLNIKKEEIDSLKVSGDTVEIKFRTQTNDVKPDQVRNKKKTVE
ncbi:MAG: hypothetical protein ACFFD4_10190 [Candidatus Odinarchaeota archaeon]